MKKERRVPTINGYSELTPYDNTIFDASENPKIFSRLQDACELLFQDIKPLLDVFEVLATRENDLS